MNRSAAKLLAGLLLVSSASACTTTAPDAAPCDSACQKDRLSGPKDPCRLILTTEAERILGFTINAIPGRAERDGLCFTVLGLSSTPNDNFSYAAVSSPGAKTQFDSATNGLRDRLSNLGDAAAWDPKDETLHVLAGDAYLWVQLQSIPGNRQKATSLARLALTRLT